MRSIIVLIGYNRPESLERLLQSVLAADFPEDDEIDLTVSLDHSNKENEIIECLKKYDWPHGEKKIRTQEKRMGLRSHVISCGELIADHDFLIMLEDDLVVAPGFYNYTRSAYAKYEAYENVIGISLYAPHTVLQNGRHFEPEYNGSDTYLCQMAQSWGQAWSKRMWTGFHEWYMNNQTFAQPLDMPDNAWGWDERSWLRYFMGYASSGENYLVYPYHSYSTNMNEVGENFAEKNSDCQTALSLKKQNFVMYDREQCVKYNAHLERKQDAYFDYSYNGEKVLMDLNGTYTKYGDYRYVVSTNRLDYRIIDSYGLNRRPQERNLIEKIPGNTIWLYDLSVKEKNTQKKNFVQVIRYDVKAISWTRLTYLGLKEGLQETIIRNRKLYKKIHKRQRAKENTK